MPDGAARAPAVAAVLAALLSVACARLPMGPRGGVQTGVASWYGQDYHGRPTASREVFDMNDMTAAHRTLPFGTNVMVTNLANDRSVVVRINDRGPFVPGRVIDLSYAAARVLGLVGPGTARVRLETLGAAAPPRPEREAEVWIQVGAYSVQENAYAVKRRLERTCPGVAVVRLDTGSGAFYRVRVKTTEAEAQALARHLADEGYPVIIIRDGAPRRPGDGRAAV